MLRILKELWRFRLLVHALVSRHLNARYRGSFFGFFWSFLNPLCLLAVYSLVFKYYIRFEVDNYAIFMFTGLLPWIWFSSGISESTNSISSGGSLITKAIFPAHILPIVTVLTNLVHFILALPLLFIFMFFSKLYPSISIISLPLIIFLQMLFMLGLSLILSSLNVYYRDIQHILGNFLTLWFFLCPIIYPVEQVPEKFMFSIYLNPMARIIQLYHDILFNGKFPGLYDLSILALISLFTFYIGCLIFNSYRDQFAESV